MSIKPTITAEDILSVENKEPRTIAPDGIYEMAIMSPKGQESLAYITAQQSKAGNDYLTVGLKFANEEEAKKYNSVFAKPVMVTGESAKWAKNFAGFIAALGLSEVPSIEEAGKDSKDRTLVTLVTSNGSLDLAGRTLKVRLGSAKEDDGTVRQTVEFVKAS